MPLMRGQVYAWGYNNCGQIGSESTVNQISPREVRGDLGQSLSNEKLKHYMYFHNCLLLIYWIWLCDTISFVRVQLMHTLSDCCNVRLHTHTFSDGVSCTSISCTQLSSLALSQRGQLFSWGYNGNGQLGIGSYLNKNTPQRVHSPAVFISQVPVINSYNMSV